MNIRSFKNAQIWLVTLDAVTEPLPNVNPVMSCAVQTMPHPIVKLCEYLENKTPVPSAR